MPIRRVFRAALCAAVPFLAAAAPPRHPAQGIPVAMQAHPGTPLDAAARSLIADDLAAARTRGDRPLVLTGTAELGGSQPALFVQLQSPQECGSAGCATTAYDYHGGQWHRVLDGATGKVTVSTHRTRGRPDLLTDDDHFVWTGTAYRSTAPAPAIDLRPRVRRRS